MRLFRTVLACPDCDQNLLGVESDRRGSGTVYRVRCVLKQTIGEPEQICPHGVDWGEAATEQAALEKALANLIDVLDPVLTSQPEKYARVLRSVVGQIVPVKEAPDGEAH